MSALVHLALACALQCPDPPAPAAGFAYDEVFDLPLTFSDGEVTTATLRHPRDSAGPCGWPVIVFIHGLFGDQHGPASFARSFAAAGYATLTFDVRGHETHSGRHTLWGLRERLDLVEVIEWLGATYPGVVDVGRLGLAGTSQGAILSLSLAGRENAPIEPNPWRGGTYPDIDALVVTNLTADFFAAFSPQSAGLHCSLASALLGPSGASVRFDYGIVADASRAVIDRDPALWAALVSDPSRNPRPVMPQITAPVLAMGAWDDYWFPLRSMLDALDALPAGVPHKLYLGTGGHSTPNAVAEIALRDSMRRQWFERFLKGEQNGIETSPRVTYAQTPASAVAYLSNQTAWERRQSSVWPPPDSRPVRLHLRQGALLTPVEPSGDEPDELLVQDVAAGFGPVELIATEFRLPMIEQEIERRVLTWRTPALTAPLRIVGAPQVHLDLLALGADWQAAVSLWDLDPAGEERYVTSGVHFGQGAPAGPTTVYLGGQCYEFAVGHRLELRLSNMLVHEPPPGAILRYAPSLDPFTLTVRHDAAALSWLTLPVPEANPLSYGTAQVASGGCVARMGSTGLASPSANPPFVLRADSVIPDRDGLLLYGFAPKQVPLSGGNLWIAPPVLRSSLIDSGGSPSTPCSGTLLRDFSSRLQSDPFLTPGRPVYAQFWYRDPQSPSLTNLTNALQFTVLP